MKLLVEGDGTLVGAAGVTFGRLVAMHVELIDRPGALTPTQVRQRAACPRCGAQIGAFCSREHGDTRKANHAERVQIALDQFDSDGTVSERSERYGDSVVCSTHSNVKGKKPPTGEKKFDKEIERDAIERVWSFWLETSQKAQRLDDKRRRIIRNALMLVGEEATKRALLGLTRSPHHQGQNEQQRAYMEIRYALKGIGDESDDERIEKAISWAAMYVPGLDVDEAKVQRWLDEVRRYRELRLRNPDAITGRQRANESYRALRSHGFTIIALDKAPWARIQR